MVAIPSMVVFAWIGDVWILRTRLIAAAFAILAVVVWPLSSLMLSGDISSLIVSQTLLIILLSVPLGSGPAMFVELFPSSDRLTGYSISFNLGMGVLGGATPMLATWLIGATDNPLVPAYMIIIAGFTAAIALMWMRDRSRESLR